MSVLIGPLGALLSLRDPEPSASVPITRPSSERTLVSGVVVTQRAPRAPRRWDLSWPYLDGADLSTLIGLDQGAFGEPPWIFYDPWAAQRNMLPPHLAVPGLGGDWSAIDGQAGVTQGDAVWVDPWPITGSAKLSTTGTIYAGNPASGDAFVPVVAGRTYTGSVTSHKVGSGAEVAQIEWIAADGAQVSVSSGAAAIGPGTLRPTVTAAAPVGAVGAYLKVVTGSGSGCEATAFQFTETPAAIAWCPGEGIPWVTVHGLDQVYEVIRGGQDRSLTATLIEVAAPAPPVDDGAPV